VRLLLDEHFSPRIARELRARGHDAVAVAERADLIGRSDGAQLDAMAAEGRAILTEDVGDFAPLGRARIRDGGRHAGLIFTNPRRFPRSEEGIGALVRAAEALMIRHPEPLALENREVWLAGGR
jgi:hypothetical protein